MKKILGVCLFMLTLQAGCQEDKIFKEVMTFEKGFKFSINGVIQTLPYVGGTTTNVYWNDILSKPATFPPSTHNHDALYKPIGYVPTWTEITDKPSTFAPSVHSHAYADITDKPGEIDLASAIPLLSGIRLPVLTTVQITALTPATGLLVYDLSLNVLKIYNGSIWKIIITNQ